VRAGSGWPRGIFSGISAAVLPALSVGGLLIFLMNINDYGVPTVFAVSVYALELFARSAPEEMSLRCSIPPGRCCCSSVYGAAVWALPVPGSFLADFGQGNNPLKNEPFLKVPAVAGLLVWRFF
jgi:hypothetical protein